MQKLSIKENITNFTEQLLSESLLIMFTDLRSNFNSGANLEIGWDSARNALIQEIIKSKSNFDNIITTNTDLLTIGNSVESDTYSAVSISELISYLSNLTRGSKGSMFVNDKALEFFLYHKSLVYTKSIAEATITENLDKENLVLFTIVSAGNPTIAVVVVALQTLQELIDLVETLCEETQTNEVYVLDKGSNTNIGIETGVKTAKSIFEIFKEVWDWVVNRRYYKEKLKNAEFVEKLAIIRTVNEMKEDGSLPPEEALRYKTLIIRKIDELLNIDTVPRKLLLDQGVKDDILVLKDYNEIRLLNEGRENSNS